MRRACSLSDLNNLANSSSNPSATAPRRKRSFHRHRNGFYLVLLHYRFYALNRKKFSELYIFVIWCMCIFRLFGLSSPIIHLVSYNCPLMLQLDFLF